MSGAAVGYLIVSSGFMFLVLLVLFFWSEVTMDLWC